LSKIVSIGQVERVQPVDPGLLHELLRHGVRQQTRHLLRELGARRAVRLHAHRVDHGVGAAAVGQLADHLGEVILVLKQVEHLGPAPADALEPLGHEIDADHAVTPVERYARGHVPDRAKAEDGDASAVRDAGVLDRLPGRRQDVRQVDEALVRKLFRHLDVRVVRVRHAQELGLAAGLIAVQLRVAEQRRAHALLAHLGGLALGLEALVAHEAAAAGDLERNDHAVARGELGHARADLLDHAHRLVAQDRALLDEGAEHLVQVQVGAADRRGRHAHDRVRGLLDRRVGNVVDPHVALSVPSQSFHPPALPE
jgi:hypothetical protein